MTNDQYAKVKIVIFESKICGKAWHMPAQRRSVASWRILMKHT